MTIKELNEITGSGEDIIIEYAGHKEKLNRYQESFQMIAYGDYLISNITIINDALEVSVKLISAKA